MAMTKKNADTTQHDVENAVKEEKKSAVSSTIEDTKLDKKVSVRSIAPWVTGSQRVTTNGDISIPPKGTVLLSREEIIAQSQNGNKLLNGVDSQGAHATWYIEDAFTRSELSFDLDGQTQTFLTQDVVKDIFTKTKVAFEKAITECVVTRAEKAYLMECIKDLNLNDYHKIDFCIKYTGIQP